MVKSLFFILTFGFFIQCTGSSTFLKKTFEKTEICAEDTEHSEGKNNEEHKTDQEKFTNYHNFDLSTFQVLFGVIQINQLYPIGYISDPFLPPRLLLS